MFEYQDGRHQDRVIVLAGGNSAEREVSLASGRQVRLALEAAGHRVRMVDPAEVSLQGFDFTAGDRVFIALHGGDGENGTIQKLLEDRQVKYTGSGPAASRLAMRKSASKERFIHAGLATPDYRILHAGRAGQDAAALLAPLGNPLVIKPDAQGSSLGVSIVRTAVELAPALATAAAYGDFVIAERFVAGRELTVALLGRQPLPIVEIVTPDGFFDYEAKYHDDVAQIRFATDLPAHLTAEIYRTAQAAAAALGTRGLVRIDLLLDRNGIPWLLEANTVPGLTDHSLAPRAARQAGYEMPDLCRWMLGDAEAADTRLPAGVRMRDRLGIGLSRREPSQAWIGAN